MRAKRRAFQHCCLVHRSDGAWGVGRSGAERVRLARDLLRSELVQYELASFPSWEGQAASFSMWVKPGKFGHLLAKHPDLGAEAVCWGVRLNETGVSVESLLGTAT
eukprot:3357473-Rhodomonas_salina.1